MALASTASKNTIETISQLSGRVECEMPNIRMNQFEGRIVLQGQSVQPLTTQQILLRGSQLRNCDFVFGACVYAGIDTKIIRNLNNSGLKFSTMEWKLNRLLMLMFCYNAVIFTVSVVFGTRWIVSLSTLLFTNYNSGVLVYESARQSQLYFR
jgi:phospholipid-transporting ATPase